MRPITDTTPAGARRRQQARDRIAHRKEQARCIICAAPQSDQSDCYCPHHRAHYLLTNRLRHRRKRGLPLEAPSRKAKPQPQ